MGFYLRKSFKCGPLRINLSKSGLGASFGVKGLRYGINSKGKEYIHAGRYGLYYKKQFGNQKDFNQENEIKPLNRCQNEVVNAIITIIICCIFILNLPNNSSVETLFKVILYFYPTITALRYKNLSLKIFFTNLLFAWSLVGWILPFAWAIPKVYDINRKMPKEQEVIYNNALNALILFQNNDPILKELPIKSSDIIKRYSGKNINKISDSEIEILSEIYKEILHIKNIYKKKLSPLREQQAKNKGYNFSNINTDARDDRLRIDANLKDEIFWKYFALDFDEKMRLENE